MALLTIPRIYNRLPILLNESSIEDLKKQWVETGKMTPEQFNNIEQAAGGKSSWVTWLGKRVLEGQLSIQAEDVEKWQEIFQLFNRYKQRFTYKDINQVKTKDQIDQFIRQALGLKTQAQSKDIATQAAKDEFAEFYRGIFKSSDEGEFKVYEIPKGRTDLYNTNCTIANKGAQTNWCTASSRSNYFEHYISHGPLIIFKSVSDPERKYQLHVESNQFMDIADNQIPWDGQFAEEACTWALKQGLIKNLPSKLQVYLDFKRELPRREDAPKADQFKVYSVGDAAVYEFKNFNIKEHYWAYCSVCGEYVDPERLPSVGKDVVLLARKGKVFEDRQPSSAWPMDEITYKIEVYTNKHYGWPISTDLAVLFDPNLPEASESIVGKEDDITLWKIGNNSAKAVITLDVSFERNSLYQGDFYIASIGTNSGTVSAAGVQRLNTGHDNGSVEIYPKNSKTLPTLVKYLVNNNIFSKENLQRELDLTEKMSVFPEDYEKDIVYSGGTGKVKSIYVGSYGVFLLGPNILFRADHPNYLEKPASTFKKFSSEEMSLIRSTLDKAGMSNSIFNAALNRYFPDLVGISKEDRKAPKVPDFLRSVENKMKPIHVPLYHRGSRTYYLDREEAYATTWDSIRPSFVKSVEGYTLGRIDKVTSGDSPVYLYWNNGNWNCTILSKNREEQTTDLCVRRGYGQGLQWNFKEIPEEQRLEESFNPIQKARLQYLAGIFD